MIRFVTALLIAFALQPHVSVFAEKDESTNEQTTVTRMTPELLWKLGRVGDAALSDDGQLVAYTVKRYDLKENSGTTTLYVRIFLPVRCDPW